MTSPEPPRFSERVLGWLLPADELDTPQGDYAEYFHDLVREKGLSTARRWYRLQVLRLLPPRLTAKIYWGIIMLRSYLQIALRNLRRNVSYSFINVTGLAIGMACFLLIMLFVRDQAQFDQWQEDSGRIHRVIRSAPQPDGDIAYFSTVPYAFGSFMTEQFAEVEEWITLQGENKTLVRPTVSSAEEYYETGIVLSDPDFFEFFSFELLKGDPARVLERTDAVVLTQSLAKKYFGEEDPVGQTIQISNEHILEVTGVAADPPHQSSIQFTLVGHRDAPFGGRERLKRFQTSEWQFATYTTYLKLAQGTQVQEINNLIRERLLEMAPEEAGTLVKSRNDEDIFVTLEPLTHSYLTSPATNRVGPTGSRRFLLVFASVAVLVLIIAAVNYMNLATARSARRAKEVGMRKVVGAARSQISRQFMGEALLLCMLALPPALLLVELALPAFNSLVQGNLDLKYFEDATLIAGLVVFTLGLGVISGSYPALYMARLKPISVLKGSPVRTSGGKGFRRSLVVFQFVVSIALIVGTVLIQRQLDYMRTTDLGLDPEQLVVVPLGRGASNQATVVKEKALQLSSVQSASLSNAVPVRGFGGIASFNNRESDLKPKVLSIDPDFLDTYGIEMIDGRSFRESLAIEDPYRAGLITETTYQELEKLNRGEVVGGRYVLTNMDIEVIGVVEDFHFTSLHDPIEPFLLSNMGETPTSALYLTLRVETDDVPAFMSELTGIWDSVAPDYPFDYFFMDDAFDDLYRAEDRLSRIFQAFTVIAVGIACLGLFGLAAFTTEQRTKEVGIRRVLGASATAIVMLLSKEFILLVLVSALLASPLAWYAISVWMEGFTYTIDIPFWVFAASGAVALLIALLTVSGQAFRAASTDPAKTLRYE